MSWLILLALLKKLDKKIDDLETVTFRKVDELPATGEANVIYFVPKTDAEEGNYSDEYIWDSASETYEQIGDSAIDPLPEVTAADNGKVLGVANGEWGKISFDKGIKYFDLNFYSGEYYLKDGAKNSDVANSTKNGYFTVLRYKSISQNIYQLFVSVDWNIFIRISPYSESGEYENRRIRCEYIQIYNNSSNSLVCRTTVPIPPIALNSDKGRILSVSNYDAQVLEYINNPALSLAPIYSTSSTYELGDLVIYNNNLYECTTAITTAESWTAAHWTQKKLSEVIDEIEQLPSVTSSDEGKALLVNDQGQWAAGELPTPSGGWTDVTGTLVAGQTAITLNCSAITADSTIDVYTNKFGVNPTNIVVRPPQVKTLRQALVSQESELDITVTANTNWNGYDPWKAFGDNSVNGAWIGDGGDPHYLQIEFDTPTSIREIDFVSVDSQRSHAISRVGYSSDGTTFTECGIVSSTMESDTGHCELDDDYEAKYFRFYFDGSYGISEYPDMSKVEVYGYDEDPQGTGSVTLTFDAQSTNTGVKVRVS